MKTSIRKILLPLPLFLLPLFSLAQLSAKWEQTYGGSGNEYGYRVRSCMDQGYIVCGSTSSYGLSDGYLVRTDSLGLTMWSKRYGGDNIDVMRSIKQLPDSGYIVAGYSNSGGHGGYDGWVLRLDKIGDTLWTKYYGTTDWDFFYDVAPTYDGGFVLAGGTYGLGMGDEDFYLVKIDAVGNVVWTRTYGGLKQDEARSIVQTGDSMIAAVGFTFSQGDTLGDSWILRVTSTGALVWSTTMGYSNAEDQAWGIANCSTYSRLYVVGQTAVTGNNDCYIHCMNYNMNSVYTVTAGGPADDNYYGIAAREDGTIATIGTTFSYGGGNGDMYFFKDRGGNAFTTFGTLLADGGYSIDFANDGGYIASGFTYGFNATLPNIYLVKIDSTGISSGVLAVREQPSPLSFGNVSVFPNPVQNEATILFDATENISGKLSIEIYDITGRKIEIPLSSQWESSSSRSATCKINTEMLSNGIYEFVISSSLGGKSSGKFIVSH